MTKNIENEITGFYDAVAEIRELSSVILYSIEYGRVEKLKSLKAQYDAAFSKVVLLYPDFLDAMYGKFQSFPTEIQQEAAPGGG
ncbi:MAG: hypothetical protein PUA61_03955 [Succinatimonas hippei]|nr:hypothetical protein [Succinatimonas hippei]